MLRHAPAWSISLAAAMSAMGLLGLSQQVLGPLPPFLFPFVAVVVVAVTVNGWAGLGVAALCVLWLNLPWLPPSSPPEGAPAPAASVLFVAAAATIVLLIVRLRRHSPPGLAAVPPASTERGLVLLMLLSALLPLLVYVAVAVGAYRAAFEDAGVRVDRAARIAEEHAARVLDLNEALIGRIVDLMGDLTDAEILARQAALHSRLRGMVQGLPQVQSVWVQDATGRPLLSGHMMPAPRAQLDVSDRDYFIWHRDGRGGLFVSQPAIGKVSQQHFFDTSRRRDRADGGFGGLVSVSLFPAYFSDFYAGLARAETGLALTLFRTDGVLLARHPVPVDTSVVRSDPAGELMRRVGGGERQGTLSMHSAFDGQLRLQSFRMLERYPVMVTAGIEHSVIVGQWQRDMAALGGFLFPMSAALVAAGGVALRRSRRERAALQRLEQEIDQRLRAEKALLQSQKLAALAQLTGSVAHDFNNLLAVVNNNAYLIERRPPDSDPRPQATAIRRAVDTGAQLTRQLLAFSRRQALRPTAVDLTQMIPRAMGLVRASVGSRVKVEHTIEPGVPAVMADASELELAILNLGINARDAMPQGGTLRVEVLRAPRGPAGTPEEVLIRVSDDGEGIAPELVERVFEPFFTTKPEGKGAGLGLAQVRAACEQVGGRVAIDSAPGRGTTFTLVLPAAARPPAPTATAPTERHIPFRVLLVEDNVELAMTTDAVLRSFGAQVTRVVTADAAIEILGTDGRGFEVVVSDIVMVGSRDGLGMARELRTRLPSLPVILMTGYAAEATAAVAEGFTVLAKPCMPEDMVAAIQRAAAKRPASALS